MGGAMVKAPQKFLTPSLLTANYRPKSCKESDGPLQG